MNTWLILLVMMLMPSCSEPISQKKNILAIQKTIFVDVSKHQQKYENGLKYKDFDLLRFEGISAIKNGESFSYPYLEVLKTKDSAYLVCYFNDSLSYESKFLKISTRYFQQFCMGDGTQEEHTRIYRTYYGNNKIESFDFLKFYNKQEFVLDNYVKFENNTINQHYIKSGIIIPKNIYSNITITDSIRFSYIFKCTQENNGVKVTLEDTYLNKKTKFIPLNKSSEYSFFWDIYFGHDILDKHKGFIGMHDIHNVFPKD